MYKMNRNYFPDRLMYYCIRMDKSSKGQGMVLVYKKLTVTAKDRLLTGLWKMDRNCVLGWLSATGAW